MAQGSKRADIINHSDPSQIANEAQPDWLKQRLDWFQDLKFGLFIHWGIYSQWGCIESWPLVPEDTWARPDTLKAWTNREKDIKRFQRDYWALNKTFNPTQFDPDDWANAAKAAGMKYVNFTTKHHDGFCMFDTHTTDYRITHPSCPFHAQPQANVTREVFDAFRDQGFAISCYFSKSDWHSPDFWIPGVDAPDRCTNYDTAAAGSRWPAFREFVNNQIEELMTGYGDIDVLWLDGGQVRPPSMDLNMAGIAEMARGHQPGLIIADRTVGGEFENIVTPEQRIPAEPLGVPWESCLTMGKGWSYRPDDELKPTSTLIGMLVDIVCKGGNFLLNVAPSPEGTLSDGVYQRLREIGDWMAINGEAIHGTRPIAPYIEGNVSYTSNDDYLYAIVRPNEEATLPPATITLTGCVPPDGSEVFLLGHEAPLTWQSHGDSAEIHLSPGELTGGHAWTIRYQR